MYIEPYLPPAHNNGNEYEILQYFYHSDHLGSASFVTNRGGGVVQHLQYLPYGELFVSQRNSEEFDSRYKFTAKELDNETSYTYFGARYYDSELSGWLSVDPMSDKYPMLSPYAYCANNPIILIDPDGRDTIDIVKNDDGKWSISNIQIVKGDDVFRVKTGDETQTYTFSEGEYGKRVNILNLENNDDYTLGIYHISGAENGGTGYTITPGGEASTGKGSNKRLPPDTYTLEQGGGIWHQPWVTEGETSGDVRSRGIKFHFGYGDPTKWTKGCFVISSNYTPKNGSILFEESESRQALINFDRNLGATDINTNKKVEGKRYTLIGAKFGKSVLDYKLILKDGF
jgi:RHS repeat-associated protein